MIAEYMFWYGFSRARWTDTARRGGEKKKKCGRGDGSDIARKTPVKNIH